MGIFGGRSKQTVNTTTVVENKSTINLDLTNTIDTGALAEAFDAVGGKFEDVLKGLLAQGQGQEDALRDANKLKVGEVLAILAGQEQDKKIEEQKIMISRQWQKILLTGVAGWVLWKVFK